MNLAEFAGLDSLGPDELRVARKHVEALVESPGWRFIHRVLASQQQAQLKLALAQPARGESADTYALRRADTAGMLRGLQYAYDAPQAVLAIAERVMAREQQAAEAAEGEQS
jgi:hypothetical protein